jgi:hypothetical protein
MRSLWRTTVAHEYSLHPSAVGAKQAKNQIMANMAGCHYYKTSTRIQLEGTLAYVTEIPGRQNELDQNSLSLGMFHPFEGVEIARGKCHIIAANFLQLTIMMASTLQAKGYIWTAPPINLQKVGLNPSGCKAAAHRFLCQNLKPSTCLSPLHCNLLARAVLDRTPLV